MTGAYRSAQNAQRDAAHPTSSVFVTANAGSGKTKVLVDRIARLLLAGAAPSACLCITFTKAAAAEMQRRLFDRLGAWCVADDAALTRDLIELGEPAPDSARLALARALFAGALETPGGLRIQTIHGFCERLLARFPLEAGVAPGFEIADDARARALQAEAWRQVSARVDGATPGAVDWFGARLHAEALDGLVAALAARRGAIEELQRRKGGHDAARAHLFARHGNPGAPADIAAAFERNVDWAMLGDAAAVLAESGGRDGDLALRIRHALDSRTLGALDRIFFKIDGDPYKTLVTAPTRTRYSALVGRLEALGEEVADVRKRLRAADRAADADALLVLGAGLSDSYRRAKEQAGVLDFDDLIARAVALLHDSAAAPWVLYKLDGGLTHILIDEGQDTSPAQWRLIEPLQQEFFSGAGAAEDVRTVFAVGDPKQSIYSFQGADPAQFLSESQRLSMRAVGAGKDFTAPTLAMSFRSSPEVLTAVDATFDGAALSDGVEEGDVVTHTAFREGETGRVELWPLARAVEAMKSEAWDAPQDTESSASAAAVLCARVSEAIGSWIAAGDGVWEKGRLRRMRAGDVLILVRKRGPIFTQVLRSLKRAGIPVAGADRVRLAEEIAVQDILAAAKVAVDPTDDLSLATFLKSPFVGMTDDDADIHPLAAGRARDETVLQRLEAWQAPGAAFARRLVGEIRAAAGQTPFDFVSMLLEPPDDAGATGWERLFARLGQEARDPVEELLQRAGEFARRGPATLHHFIDAIEGDGAEVKRESEQEVDAVQVMTVHGAKGLERPVVILADTTAPPNEDPSGSVQIDADGISLRVRRSDDDEVTGAVRAAAEHAALLEHRRLLYVAMTRARDRLIVCGAARGNSKEGATPNSWWRSVSDGMTRAGALACETPFGPGLALGERLAAPGADAPIASTKMAPPSWLRAPAPAQERAGQTVQPSRLGGAVLSPRGALAQRFARGKRIHGLLQRLPDVPPPRREDVARAWLALQGATPTQADAEACEALTVLNDPQFAQVFGEGSRAEAPIIACLADGAWVRGAIDRMVVTSDEVLFVDFKTDRPPPERVEEAPPRILAQLAAYRAALRLIFPGRQVRAALVWTDGPRLMPVPEELLKEIDAVAGTD